MSEIIIPRKNIILDATVLSTLMGCTRLTDFRFNHHLIAIDGKSNSLESGSIVHKVLEYYHKSLINGFNQELAIQNGLTAGELYIRGCKFCSGFISSPENPKPQCNHQINEFEGVKNTPEESTNKPNRIGWRYALDTCQQYFEFYRNDYWTTLEVETVKSKILYQDDEIRILWKAKLDLVVDTNQGIYPVDHKTMKQNRDTISLNNQFIGQCLLLDTRTVIINKIGFQTSLEPKEKFKRVTMSYSADRLIEWQSEILPYYAKRMLHAAESEYWAPNFDHCETKYGVCAFKEICEANRDMREELIKQQFIVGEPWEPRDD